MEVDYTLLGLAIKQIRLSRKMTQEQLGKLAGVGNSCISRIEAGERAFSIPKVNALGEALKIPTAWIYFLATDARGVGPLNEAIRNLQELIRIEIGVDLKITGGP